VQDTTGQGVRLDCMIVLRNRIDRLCNFRKK